MERWERAAQARRALDRWFSEGDLAALRNPPRGGWAKATRNALGMAQVDLAARLGVSPPAIASLERSERAGTISMGKLAELAQALDCTLVYAMVPNSTLEDTVQREARRRAAEAMGYVGRTMDLEDQGLAGEAAGDLLEREVRQVIEANRVWRRR